jgi:ubiquinone biosynthesis protein COQ9
MAPYIDKWPQAMALGLQPKNLTTTLQQISSISDEIWKLSGDQSTDINWYTKRALLSKIYVLTETYMLQDKSPNFEQTWEFLDNRLEDTR